MKEIPIIIVAWNGAGWLHECLTSLLAQDPCPKVVIWDNASNDGTEEIIVLLRDRAKRSIQLIRSEANLGFTCAANAAMSSVLSDSNNADLGFIVLLNQDTVVCPGWLEALQDGFDRWPDAGIIGCKSYYPGGSTLQHAGGHLIHPRLCGLHFGHHEPDSSKYNVPREVDFVTGAAMGLRIEFLRQVGLFDEIYSPGYYEDVDICFRGREFGWKTYYCPGARLFHAESASFKDPMDRLLLSHRNRLLFGLRWMDMPSFREEFEQAEMAHIQKVSELEDVRALRMAYLHVLLMFNMAMKARLPMACSNKVLLDDLADFFVRLRQACTERLMNVLS